MVTTRTCACDVPVIIYVDEYNTRGGFFFYPIREDGAIIFHYILNGLVYGDVCMPFDERKTKLLARSRQETRRALVMRASTDDGSITLIRERKTVGKRGMEIFGRGQVKGKTLGCARWVEP